MTRLSTDARTRFLESGSIIRLNSEKIAIGYGKRSWLAQPELDRQNFYFPDFFLGNPFPWCVHDRHEIIEIKELSSIFPVSEKSSLKISWSNECHAAFVRTFADLQRRFKKKELTKAVPFIFERSPDRMTVDILTHSLGSLLRHALSFPIQIYGFWEKDSGILGGTPESLFSIHSHDRKTSQLKTMACAGTYRLSRIARPVILDKKELKEHRIVIEDIAEVLSPFGRVEIGSLGLIEIPGLCHLTTPIGVELSAAPKWSFEEIVKALHPTPALGAFPRRVGKEWLNHYQTIFDRRRFGAPVGYCDFANEVNLCLVAIRNVQWDEEGMAIGAGCGVIEESRCRDEWREIVAKIESIKIVLGI